MQLKVLIVFFFGVVSSAPRKIEDGNFVMIGHSQPQNQLKKLSEGEDKNVRSSYPMMMSSGSRPSSEYHYGPSYNGYGGYGGPITPSPSLISANVHLLEPFLLVTFLMFVLSLIDKARVPPQFARNDFIQEINTTSPEIENFRSFLHKLSRQ